MRSVNSARARLKPVVLMLAILLAITSRFVCWAFIPAAAIASALMTSTPSNSCPADLEVGGYDLVADGDRRLQLLLCAHDGLDHLLHRGAAFDAGHRGGL